MGRQDSETEVDHHTEPSDAIDAPAIFAECEHEWESGELGKRSHVAHARVININAVERRICFFVNNNTL